MNFSWLSLQELQVSDSRPDLEGALDLGVHLVPRDQVNV